MSKQNTNTLKWKYTFKLIAGLIFLIAIIALLYWLLYIYEVRNFLGLIAIIIFLILPAVHSFLTLPNEFRALKLIWESDDPENLDKVIGDLREKGIL